MERLSKGCGNLEKVCWKKLTNISIFRSYRRRRSYKDGFKSFDEIMKDAREIISMLKYAEKRLGIRFVVGREGWKSLVVS